MGLASIIRSAVATADAVTKDLQPEVLHKEWVSQTDAGVHTYKSSVKRRALVDMKQRQVRTLEGQLVTSHAYIAFLTPVSIGRNDAIILPDGTTGPIINTTGFVDPATGRGYVTEVYLG